MPVEEHQKSAEASAPRITGLDVLKNVSVALVIAFLIYWIPVLAEQFFSPTEIRYRQVTLGDLSGYLFSIQNYSRRPIEEVEIFIDAPRVGTAFQDGAVSMEVSTSSHPAMVKLKTLAPYSETTLFVSLESHLEARQIRANSSSTITVFEDAKVVQRQLWNLSTFFSSTFSALLYFVFGLYVSAHRRQTKAEVADLRADMNRLHEKETKFKEEANNELKELRWRLMKARVHMVRRIIRLDEEVEVWRRFFRSIYSSTFGARSDAEPVIEIILKKCGVHLVKRLRDYSEAEFLEILEESERNLGSSKESA